MDEDGNKKLNEEEFKTGIQETGIDLEEDEIKEVFEKFDTDGDGNISVEEFLVGIRVSVLDLLARLLYIIKIYIYKKIFRFMEIAFKG